MKTDTVELPKPDNGSIMVGREEVCLGHSDAAMREYAAQVAAAENYGLLSLLFDIRKAAGDPTGKLMQSELVELIAALRADAERWVTGFIASREQLYIRDGMKVEQARIHAETDAQVVTLAIARSKKPQA